MSFAETNVLNKNIYWFGVVLNVSMLPFPKKFPSIREMPCNHGARISAVYHIVKELVLNSKLWFSPLIFVYKTLFQFFFAAAQKKYLDALNVW